MADRHNTARTDAQFRLPPTIQQMRGNRGDALLFTQMAETSASGGGGGSTNGSAGHPQCEAKEPLLPRSEDPSQPQQQQQQQRQQRQQQQQHVLQQQESQQQKDGGGGDDDGTSTLKGRKKIIRRARKHPTVDRIITFLQDKQVDDDHQDLIQDLQLPLLRKILNVVFIALGVVFLLGVIVVIIYTNIGKDDHSKKT